MGRPKKTTSEEMVSLLEEFYETEAYGDPSKLKFSRLEAFAASKGYVTKAYDFKRDTQVRQRIDELKSLHDIETEKAAKATYKTLEIDRILKGCRRVEDIEAALREMDAYWKKMYDQASSVLERDSKFMAEKTSYEKEINRLGRELDDVRHRAENAEKEIRKISKENTYLRKVIRTTLYPELANSILKEKHLPVPDNVSVRPEAVKAMTDGDVPSSFEGLQKAPAPEKDWKEKLQEAMERQVDGDGKK